MGVVDRVEVEATAIVSTDVEVVSVGGGRVEEEEEEEEEETKKSCPSTGMVVCRLL